MVLGLLAGWDQVASRGAPLQQQSDFKPGLQDKLTHLGLPALLIRLALHRVGCKRPGGAYEAYERRVVVDLRPERAECGLDEGEAAAGVVQHTQRFDLAAMRTRDDTPESERNSITSHKTL